MAHKPSKLLQVAVAQARDLVEANRQIWHDRGSGDAPDLTLEAALRPIAEAAGIDLPRVLSLAQQQDRQERRGRQLDTLVRDLPRVLERCLSLPRAEVALITEDGERLLRVSTWNRNAGAPLRQQMREWQRKRAGLYGYLHYVRAAREYAPGTYILRLAEN